MTARVLRLSLFAVVALLTLTSCEQGDEGDAEEEAAAIPVEIARPTRGDIFAIYAGTATIEAFSDASVVAKVAGEIRSILVEEGDTVESGQVLARLDGDRLKLEVQQTEANLRKAERDFQRNVELNEKGLISAGEFEKIRYEMEALKATHDLAKLEYSYTQIRAPIDGVVSERFVKVGNTISVNAPTFEVTNLDPLISYLHVPEQEYRRIKSGQVVDIKVDALQDSHFEGIVARLSPVVDPETGTFKITIEISDPSRRLKPGMFGRISIIYDMHANALQIPRSAIVGEADQSIVFVVNDNTAERRIIRTGFSDSGQIEVVEGLDDSDALVIVGQSGLKNDSTVSVINAEEFAEQTEVEEPGSK